MQKYLSENIVDIFFILGISSIAILVISALSIGYFIKKIPINTSFEVYENGLIKAFGSINFNKELKSFVSIVHPGVSSFG